MRPAPSSVVLVAILSTGCPQKDSWDSDESPSPTDSGLTDSRDADGDGYGANEDCDDGDPSVHPGAQEVCDLSDRDEDCDGGADDNDPGGASGKLTWYWDGDEDGHGGDAYLRVACDPSPRYVSVSGDCDDGDPATYPGAPDPACDGVDNDCDGVGANTVAVVDGAWYDDLQSAVDAAPTDGAVDICPGTWRVNALLIRRTNEVLTLRSWSGSAEDTVLDGGYVDTILESYSDGTLDLVLENLGFTRGARGRPTDAGLGGGAVFATDTHLSVLGCDFSENIADDGGAAIALWGTRTAMYIESTRFTANGTEIGGAIYQYFLPPAPALIPVEIHDSTFEDNFSTGLSVDGAVALYDVDFTITNSSFTGNSNQGGGAAALGVTSEAGDTPEGMSVRIANVTFEDNIHDGGNPGVAGLMFYMANEETSIEMENCTFSRNIDGPASHSDQAAMHFVGGTVSLDMRNILVEGSVGYQAVGIVTKVLDANIIGFSCLDNIVDGPLIALTGSEWARVAMEDVEISGNVSQGQSPGLSFATTPGEVSITDSLFTDNSTWSNFSVITLGGETTGSVDLRLARVTIQDNTSTFERSTVVGSGLHVNYTGSVSLDSVTVEGNVQSAGETEFEEVTGTALIFQARGGPLSVSMTGGSVTNNRSDTGRGGGLQLLAGATFVCEGTDWGSGVTDNSPSDVVGCDSTFGADASFTWDEASGLLCE